MFAVEVWCISYEDEGIVEDEDEEEAHDEEPRIAIYQHYNNGERMQDEDPPSELKIDGISKIINLA